LGTLAHGANITGGISFSEVSFTGTDHLILSNAIKPSAPNSGKENLFMHENTLGAEIGVYGADIRFTNRLAQDEGDTDVFRLEKKTLTADWEDWELKLGDSHQEFGRGIALALYGDDVFGLNNTVEGLSLKFRPGQIEVVGFAGRINELKNPVAVNPIGSQVELDHELWLAGSSVVVRASDSIKVGAHYFIALNKLNEPTVRRFDKIWNTLGLSYSHESVLEDVDIYLESNLLHRQLLRGEEYETQTPGVGSYGSFVWSPTPWRVKLEFKDYRNYHFPFRRAPTLEEDIVETLNTEAVTAARFYAEHRNIESGVLVHGSYLIGEDRELKSPLHHGVLGLNTPGPLKSKLEFKTGYRTLPDRNNMIHGSITMKASTFKNQSFDITYQKQYSKLTLNVIPTLEDRNKFNISYSFSSHFNLAFGYEYMPSNESDNQNFFNIGASVKWGDLLAKAFVGETSGGTLCSGGVCRQVPPYSGAMIETVYSF